MVRITPGDACDPVDGHILCICAIGLCICVFDRRQQFETAALDENAGFDLAMQAKHAADCTPSIYSSFQNLLWCVPHSSLNMPNFGAWKALVRFSGCSSHPPEGGVRSNLHCENASSLDYVMSRLDYYATLCLNHAMVCLDYAMPRLDCLTLHLDHVMRTLCVDRIV